MSIPIKLLLTSSGDIDYYCDNDNALAISTYVQVQGSGEGADSDLRAALFRLASALDKRVASVTHRASAVAAGGAYTPPTSAEYDACMIDFSDPAVSDTAVDLETAVTSMLAQKKLICLAAGMAQQKANVKRVMLSNTDDTLTHALLAAAAPFPYLSHLPLLPFVRDHSKCFGRMPVNLLGWTVL
jgi:hypothetical protein